MGPNTDSDTATDEKKEKEKKEEIEEQEFGQNGDWNNTQDKRETAWKVFSEHFPHFADNTYQEARVRLYVYTSIYRRLSPSHVVSLLQTNNI